MIRSLVDYLKLAAAYVRFNFKAQLEYRGAFFPRLSRCSSTTARGWCSGFSSSRGSRCCMAGV